jgi:hypothetical protein
MDLLTLLVPPEQSTALTTTETAGLGQVQQIKVLAVQSDEDAQIMAAVQLAAHEKLAEIEADRVKITKPMHAAKAAVDALFKKASKPYEALKAECRAKLESWEVQKRETLLAARKQAELLTAQGQNDLAAAIVLDAQDDAPKPYKVAWKWVFRVKDVNALPDAWKKTVLNEALAAEYCAAYKDSEFMPNVPGMEFERVASQGVKR